MAEMAGRCRRGGAARLGEDVVGAILEGHRYGDEEQIDESEQEGDEQLQQRARRDEHREADEEELPTMMVEGVW